MDTHILHRTKFLSIGDSLTGKSCIVKRFCEKKFYEKYKPTIGIDYGVKTFSVGKNRIKIDFWDVSGHPEFSDIRHEFYSDSQIVCTTLNIYQLYFIIIVFVFVFVLQCLLVYDVTCQESFENIETLWLNELNPFINLMKNKIISNKLKSNHINYNQLYTQTKLYLIANKIDLSNRQISSEIGKSFAKAHNCEYFETSSKTGIGINDLFESVFQYLTVIKTN